MEIILHVHHANVTEVMRTRAERAVRKLASRLSRAVDAVVRFEYDGGACRVELELRTARRAPIVAEGSAAHFGSALTRAIERLEREVRDEHAKAVRHRRAMRRAKAA
ncbi:MAG: HPF/RaiA family ribosome-associated protein [Gemmatimonadota bacterium]|nr:HPF/RaiA family ribosome-associated protein [Gemmatimonadota bacterium]